MTKHLLKFPTTVTAGTLKLEIASPSQITETLNRVSAMESCRSKLAADKQPHHWQLMQQILEAKAQLLELEIMVLENEEINIQEDMHAILHDLGNI